MEGKLTREAPLTASASLSVSEGRGYLSSVLGSFGGSSGMEKLACCLDS